MHHVEATFLVDYFFPLWPVAALVAWLFKRGTLPAVGFYGFIPVLPLRPKMTLRYRTAIRAVTLLACGFILAAELPCYFDFMAPPAWVSAQTTCNEFMWHGYVAWPFGNPPIPSYDAWWSTPWLIIAFGSQILSCRAIVSYVVFRDDRRSEKR